MTGAEFKSIRTRLGLTQSELARALRLGANGERTVRRWETGKIPVTGPASVAMEAFEIFPGLAIPQAGTA